MLDGGTDAGGPFVSWSRTGVFAGAVQPPGVQALGGELRIGVLEGEDEL